MKKTKRKKKQISELFREKCEETNLLEDDSPIVTFNINQKTYCFNYNNLVTVLNGKEIIENPDPDVVSTVKEEFYANIFCDWVVNQNSTDWKEKENPLESCMTNFDEGYGGQCGKRLFLKFLKKIE